MHISRICSLLVIVATILLAACTTTSFPAGEACVADDFVVLDGFAAARRGNCKRVSANSVRTNIRPEESKRINDSAWFAFRIVPQRPVQARVTLKYTGGHHRYWPKISEDGIAWYRLDERYVEVSEGGRRASITVPLSDTPIWVAAQEIISPSSYRDWVTRISANSGIPATVLGKSRGGLDIQKFDTDPQGKEVLFLMGRQHPPEVSGAIAFLAFTETVLGDSDLAKAFRARFRVIAIPVLNPDGVTDGNWRLNLGGVDLNRDWGKFTQPETALVGRLLDELDLQDARLRMFIDFHSTRENVFYTQLGATSPPGFTAKWLKAAAARITDYSFDNDQAPASSPHIAKNYIFDRYGIPAVTFEAGDETDRDAVRAAARVFAEELMLQMLEQVY